MVATIVKSKSNLAPISPAPKVASPPAVIKAKPDYLQKYTDDKGKGYSNEAADSVVPFLDVCASTQNPQLNPKHEKYIAGIVLGDIMIKGGTPPFVSGQKGLLVQPCAFDKAWVEWVPRIKGGGFVTRYSERPSTAVERPSPENPARTRIYNPANGNEIIETRYHYVRLENGQPYVMAFKSTGHTVSREWTQQMKLLGDAAWAHRYRVTTKLKVRGQQEWYIFAITPVLDADGQPAYVDEATYLAGEALYNSVASGLKTAADEEDGPTGDSEI
jgi:hypothetical protein